MNRNTLDAIAIRWHRAGPRCIEWTISGPDYASPAVENTYHCDGYATFYGSASGLGLCNRQAMGWANSVWAERDADVSRMLRRTYPEATSVRRERAPA
jgi:hypothetical protein